MLYTFNISGSAKVRYFYHKTQYMPKHWTVYPGFDDDLNASMFKVFYNNSEINITLHFQSLSFKKYIKLDRKPRLPAALVAVEAKLDYDIEADSYEEALDMLSKHLFKLQDFDITTNITYYESSEDIEDDDTLLEDLLNKGWQNDNHNGSMRTYSLFTYQYDNMTMLKLDCHSGQLMDTAIVHYEIYYDNQILYKSPNMTLKELLTKTFEDLMNNSNVSRFLGEVEAMKNIGFNFHEGSFTWTHTLTDTTITYYVDPLNDWLGEYRMFAIYNNEHLHFDVSTLSDIIHFDFTQYEENIITQQILERGAFRRLRKRL